MPIYTIFDKITGAMTRQISKPKNDGPPVVSGNEIYLKGDNCKNIVVFDERSQAVVLYDKPKSSITLTDTKLENLPNPTIVTISGNGATFRETIEDGEFEFSVDVPGEYVVKCESKVELPVEYKVVIK